MTPLVPPIRWRRVLLVGFMGAGKTTLGPRLAARLGWEFLDVDAELVRRTGLSIPGYFQQHGEAAFRAAEARLTGELSSRDRLVLAPGGGWIAEPGSFEGLPAGSAVVWLRVSVPEALRRVAASGETRPLLEAADPAAAAWALLARREPRYALAHHTVDVDGRTPDALTEEIVEWLKTSSW